MHANIIARIYAGRLGSGCFYSFWFARQLTTNCAEPMHANESEVSLRCSYVFHIISLLFLLFLLLLLLLFRRMGGGW